MTASNPPRMLQKLLVLVLPVRDRDVIAGDLLETYREDKLPQLGRLRSNLWYAREVVSLIPWNLRSLSGGRLALALVCLFTGLAGAWLGTMDLLLQSPGYLQREIISVTIVAQALLTLLAIAVRATGNLRLITLGGCAGILYLGIGAFIAAARNPHFEGYIVLIAFALCVQSTLTLITFARRPAPPELRQQPL